jgi:hypothetical protein
LLVLNQNSFAGCNSLSHTANQFRGSSSPNKISNEDGNAHFALTRGLETAGEFVLLTDIGAILSR